MFRRHRTDPGREATLVASAFHDRLAGTPVTVRTERPSVDPVDLRGRLGVPARGLRDRLDQRLDRRLGAA